MHIVDFHVNLIARLRSYPIHVSADALCRYTHTLAYEHTYTHTHNHTHIERERERGDKREEEGRFANLAIYLP